MSNVNINPFVPLKFIRHGALPVGLDFIWHHYETVVARRAPILHVFQNGRFVRHPGKSFQLDLGRLTAVERRVSLVFVERPGVDVPPRRS